MKDLVLVDPRVQRARLFREAIGLYRRRLLLLRERGQQLLARAEDEQDKVRRVFGVMNSVAARRHDHLNGDEVRLQVFESAVPAIAYLRQLGEERRAVVFSDVYLSGIELVAAMKRDPSLRRVPTVLLVSDAASARVREAWKAGSSAIVHLPMELPGMLVRVADAVEFWFKTATL